MSKVFVLKSIFLICILHFSVLIQASNISVRHYTTEYTRLEKGLSQNTPFAVMQDSNGFLWIGTWDGLNRFDAYNFTVFRPDKKDPEGSISGETIRCLYEDAKGYLWIGTESGLSRLNRYTFEFTNFSRQSSVKNNLSSDTIYALAGTDQMLLIATHRGLNIYDFNSNSFQKVNLFLDDPQNDLCQIVNTVYMGEKAYAWIGTNCGMIRYDVITGETAHFKATDKKPIILSDTILAFAKDQSGHLWIGTAGGLTKLHEGYENHTFFKHHPDKKNALSHNYVTVLHYSANNKLWVGTYGGGLNKYIDSENGFKTFKNIPGQRHSLSHNYIQDITDDDFGNIWVAAWKGLNKINLNANLFNHYHHISGQKNTLSSNTVWGFFEDDGGAIWIATEYGINILDREKDNFSYIKKEPNSRNTLPSNRIRAIIKDHEGIYWIGTSDQGLSSFNKKTGKFTHYTTGQDVNKGLPNNQVWTIAKDHNNDLWFGTFGGLVHYDREKDSFTHYLHDPANDNSLAYNLILDLKVDSKNKLWISTYNGLSVLDIATKDFTNYRYDIQNPASISSSRVFSVTEDSRGYYWVSTMGGGLNLFDPHKKTFKAYTREDGLANNIVYKALEDNNGDLWITTNSGMSFLNLKNDVFVNYDIRDGIQGSEFNGGAAYKTRKGEIIAGGMNGFNIFFPDEFTKTYQSPAVVVTAFKVFNKTIPIQFKNKDTIKLSYRENFIAFEFAALDFTNPPRNKYAYKLKGFDRDWTYTDATRRIAEYTNIPPGKYVFGVRGTNSYGEWSDQEFTITLLIKPAWYMKWWFKAAVIFTIFSILTLILYERYQKVRKKHLWEKQVLAYEKQVFQLRQKALSLQMNPHFIFNTLNSIQNFILKDNTDNAIRYMGKLSQLMRLILSSTRDMYVPIVNEIKVLTHYLDLEKIRFDDTFDYKIELDNSIDGDFVAIPPMVIQPFVENALLHGILHKSDKGFIHISLVLEKDSVVCTIEDDGVGRKKSAEIKKNSGLKHRSRGIAITKNRLDLFEKAEAYKERIIFIDKLDDDGNALGTKVIVVLPFVEY